MEDWTAQRITTEHQLSFNGLSSFPIDSHSSVSFPCQKISPRRPFVSDTRRGHFQNEQRQ